MALVSSRPPRHPWLRAGFLATGGLLILITPAAALLPGPAGIFTFAGGLAIVLQNSLWAKRQFARRLRRYPRVRGMTDRALRRRSAQRRRERDATR